MFARHPARLARAALLLAALGCAAPAQAGLFDDDEARAQIAALRQQIDAIKAKTDTLSGNQLDFANQLEALRADVAQLRGQIEVLNHGIETAQKRQQDFYVDLDNRLRALETAARKATEEAQQGAQPAPAVADNDTAEYEKALEALKASRFKEAAAAFDQFIAKFPKSALAPSAHYWGAYAHGQLKAVLKAASMLGTFATNWPEDERAPEALESQSAYLSAAKDVKGARAALEYLARMYPKSEQGKRAKAQLQKK
jgi:tol-pal system protein YbgF